MKYTEQNYPLLRFLKWSAPLGMHPEMRRLRKQMEDSMRRNSRREFHPPFLDFAPAELTGPLEMDGPAFLIRRRISELWPELQSDFSEKVELMSRRFFEAFDRSYATFLSVDVFKSVEGDFRGTLIVPSGTAFCYSFTMKSPLLDTNGMLRYGINGYAMKLMPDGRTLVDFIGDGIVYDAESSRQMPQGDYEPTGIFDFIIVYHLFRKYAPIETMDAKSARPQSPQQPEVRTTLRDVRFLDATWYTTIVRSEGFGVRGHFRLQPCGTGRKDRKLIYINEFRKHGYVRKARLLTETDDQTT